MAVKFLVAQEFPGKYENPEYSGKTGTSEIFPLEIWKNTKKFTIPSDVF